MNKLNNYYVEESYSEKEQSKNKFSKKRYIILAVIAIYLIFSLMDAMGVFVAGTYYYEESSLFPTDQTEQYIILSPDGNVYSSDYTVIYSYKVSGNKLYFIRNGGSHYITAQISNGVIKTDTLLEQSFCKKGKQPSDILNKSLVDIFRIILSPASKLISDIIH